MATKKPEIKTDRMVVDTLKSQNLFCHVVGNSEFKYTLTSPIRKITIETENSVYIYNKEKEEHHVSRRNPKNLN